MKHLTLRIRRWIMVLLALVVMGIFFSRLMNMQIVESETYKNMKNRGYISTQTVKATRGEIVDRNGEPLAVNRMGYDVILDKAFLPAGEQNAVILKLMELMELLGEEWTDTLPITEQEPYSFRDGHEDDVKRLRSLLEVQPYATAQHMMSRMVERYKLAGFTPEQQRKLAAVRCEMEQRGFNWNVQYTFASDINIASVIQLKERSYELPGVDVVESAVRSYPNGDIAPHIIGQMGPIYAEEYEELKAKGYAMDDRLGKSGVEKAFEDMLRGENGQRQIFIGNSGEAVEAVESRPPVPGNTVVTTLDVELQRLLQTELANQIDYLQEYAPAGQGKESDAGAGVVVNCKTGELLAAATYPSYNHEDYRKNYSELVAQTELRPLFNRAIIGVYAPGSTFKPAVGLAGLKHGVIDESSHVSCGRVYTYYSDYQPTCLGAHGSVNIVNALRVSCNIFFYDVGRRVGIENIVDMAAQLGLGQPTGIEIPEALGLISSPEAKQADPNNNVPWYSGDVLQSSIGQMYNWYTPLQLANYAATIGNRGTRMKVTLVREVYDYAMRTLVEPFEPQVAHHVDAPRDAFESVVKGMVAASGPAGTASADFGYYPVTVASKTGTPETNDLPNSVFICFAPAENPQYAICIIIEKGWHGYTGAPVARKVFDRLFGLNQPPETESPQAEASREESAQPDSPSEISAEA